MAKGISIGVAGDAREFASAVKSGVIAPLEDADDAIKKIGRDGSLDDLERDMTDAQKATSKYESELRDAIETQKKAARGSRDIGDESRKGFRDAGGASGEFKDEALANFSEVTSSFDGSMTSIVDLVQGTLGGLATLPGVGIGLAALGAAFGAVFTGMSTAADENAQAAAERIQKMYDDMKESGDSFVSEQYISDSISEMIQDEGKLADARKRAAEAGISVQTQLRAEAGDRDALGVALEAAKQKYAELHDRIDTVVESGGKVSGELSGQSSAAFDLVQHYQSLIGSQDSASAKADLFRQSTSKAADAMSNAATKAQGFASAVNGIPRSKTLTISVDDAVAREHLREIGKAINVDMFVTPRTGRGIN